jgi:hypothetical protein
MNALQILAGVQLIAVSQGIDSDHEQSASSKSGYRTNAKNN